MARVLSSICLSLVVTAGVVQGQILRPIGREVPAAVAQTRAQVEALAKFQREVEAAELPRLVLDGENLRVEHGALVTTGYQRVKVLGSPDVDWVLRAMKGAAIRYVTLERVDLREAEGEGLWLVSMSDRNALIKLEGHGGARSKVYSTQLTHRNGMVQLIATEMQDGRAGRRIVDVTARTFAELQGNHPAEFRRHALPLLEGMQLRDFLVPGASDVYRVFTEIAPTPQVTKRFLETVVLLGSNAADDRDLGERRLKEMGGEAVLAALRTDLSVLTPEERTRVESFVASHGRRRAEPAQLRQDPMFMIDCLEYEDPAVRAAALKALEELLNEDVPFDVDAPAEQRAAAANELRKKVARRQAERAPVRPIGDVKPQ